METIMIARIQAIVLEKSRTGKEVIHIQVQPITGDEVFYDYYFSNDPEWNNSKRRAEFLYATGRETIESPVALNYEPVVHTIVENDLYYFIDKEIEIIFTDSGKVRYFTHPYHRESWLKQMKELSK